MPQNKKKRKTGSVESAGPEIIQALTEFADTLRSGGMEAVRAKYKTTARIYKLGLAHLEEIAKRLL